MRMRQLLIALFCLLMANTSQSAPGDQLVAQVNGRIKVNVEGNVSEVSFRNVTSADLNRFLEMQVRKWEFHPMKVNGQPVSTDAGFKFRLLANFDGAGNLQQIAFQDVIIEPTELELAAIKANQTGVDQSRRPSPEYPYVPLRKNVGAELKLAVKVLPDGTIGNAAVSEMILLNAEKYAPASLLRQYQRAFSESALSAVKKWKYSSALMTQSNCTNGCTGLIPVTYESIPAPWMRYTEVNVPEIPWLIVEQVKDVEAKKSQLLVFKQQPSSLPIDAGS